MAWLRCGPPLLRLLQLLLLLLAPCAARRACSVSSFGRVVHCRLQRWNASLTACPWPRSHVHHLHIDILRENSVLTAAHLAGFSALRVLIVRGRCIGDGPPLSPYIRVCQALRGLVDIGRGAFAGTPLLDRLYLHAHPLPVLRNLHPLRRLRRLHLKQAFALRHIDPPSLVPTLEALTLLQNNVSQLHSGLLKGLARLRSLSWTTISRNLTLHPRAIADLPALGELRLGCFAFCFENTVTFGRAALANLPGLRAVSLRNLMAVRLLGRPICRLPGASIERFHYVSSNPAILKHCSDLWRCERCGRDPDAYPQSVVFHNLWLTRFSRDINRRLTSILPASGQPLNVTTFYNDGTSFTDLTDELARFPLLRRLHFHSPKPGYRMSTFESTVRLVNNPLAFLPAPGRLLEARLAVQLCDCFVIEMIDWARVHLRPAARVLRLACDNMRCTCPVPSVRHQPTAEPSPWMPLDRVADRLRPYCHPAPELGVRPMPAKLCSPEPHCVLNWTGPRRPRPQPRPRSRPSATSAAPGRPAPDLGVLLALLLLRSA